MTIYLLSVHGADDFELPDDFNIEEVYADVDVVNKEMMQKGAWVFGGGLHPADTATVVRAGPPFGKYVLKTLFIPS